jgi:hypothetical protein
MARRQAEFDGARTQLDVQRLEAKWRQEDAAIERTENLQAEQLRELRDRVLSLERCIHPMIRQRGVFDTMHDRLHALEQRQLRFCGVHEAGRQYRANSLVVRNGGLWCALTDTAARPGASTDWQLAVKSGETKEPALR